MKRIAVKLCSGPFSAAALVLLAAFDVSADKIWLAPTNGLWQVATNWSGGAAPSGGTNATTVWLTNANSKVITIDSTTPAANLVAAKLNLWAWSNTATTNALQLTDVAPGNPLTLSNALVIGRGGALGLNNSSMLVQNSLTVSNGGSLGITNSSLLVNAGAGMFFNVYGGNVILDSGSITVGDTNVPVRVGRSSSATLTINGGAMQAGGHMILGEAGFNNSQGNLRMAGGSLNLNSFLSLGDGAIGSTGVVVMTGGQLTVTNSGTNGYILVGNLGKGQMIISNATVNISSELSIGDNSGSTGFVFLASSQLTVATNSTNVMRIGNNGSGQMIVSNATLVFPDTSVGRHAGSVGVFTLQSNAMVLVTDDLSIGRFADPVNPTNSAHGNLLMTGGQLMVTNLNTSIWVGREGIGQMTVSNGAVQANGLLVAAVPTNTASGNLTLAGGTVLVLSNFVVGNAGFTTGKVSLVAGALSVTNQNASAVADFPSATMTFNSGIFETDNLRLTNNVSRFNFNGGTLRSRNTTVNNALPFVVGDGTNAATFQLVGGTHVFANGLTISSNATLSGCGTIVGTILNFGTIATNCGVVSGPPSITQQPTNMTVAQGATATFSVAASSSSALSYQWRFSGLPGDIPGATNSTLAITGAQGTNAGNYRVVVSNTSGSVTSVVASLRVLIPTTIANTSLVGTNLNLSFSTISGLNYTIEYKNNLNDPTWTLLLTHLGDGNLFTPPAVDASVPSRFYRIRVE